MLDHYGVPVPFGHSADGLLKQGLYGALHLSFVGPPAVIVFFVISGFCIHFPNRGDKTPKWIEYYSRRYLRIGVPMGCVMVISHAIPGEGLRSLGKMVLWSLYCEIVYYTVYPGLTYLKRLFGWRFLLVCTFSIAALVVALNCNDKAYADLGTLSTSLLGLPCWILGCLLAEESDMLAPVRVRGILYWRILIWIAACVCAALRFHTPVGYVYTLDLFAILVFFWLRMEIRHNRFTPPWKYLERFGVWSYSLYLIHIPALALLGLLCGGSFPSNHLTGWLIKIFCGLFSAYIFYVVVELPSHLMARNVKYWLHSLRRILLKEDSVDPASP
jgi:peptidoglycan/LPS O-acetylase OafA/YrhL